MARKLGVGCDGFGKGANHPSAFRNLACLFLARAKGLSRRVPISRRRIWAPHAGPLAVRRTCWKPVCRESLQQATCAAAASSASRPRLVKDRVRFHSFIGCSRSRRKVEAHRASGAPISPPARGPHRQQRGFAFLTCSQDVPCANSMQEFREAPVSSAARAVRYLLSALPG